MVRPQMNFMEKDSELHTVCSFDFSTQDWDVQNS